MLPCARATVVGLPVGWVNAMVRKRQPESRMATMPMAAVMRGLVVWLLNSNTSHVPISAVAKVTKWMPPSGAKPASGLFSAICE